MEEDSNKQGLVMWGLGLLGLGGVVAAVTIPKIGIWIALAIILLALLLFGGYFLWRRAHERSRRQRFSSAMEQNPAAPKSISDAGKRADLDGLRQKFQKGLEVFKSHGKDIYKLPWYVIIGESGSGKSEAIRHSEMDFPPGLQDELKGYGGTVNMDWWFTNRGIILDTAGSMIFNEARAGEVPEWREFLRLLKRSRPNSPINGLFLVLSVESLIKDSSDKIAQKARVLAQQLELIQRTLDVRFPVYLLVTKCDLLTGFREYFEKIDDPHLQHQIFGWSNPDPLDSPFRPDLVAQHLEKIADRLRRRRLALLLRESGDTQLFYAGPAKASWGSGSSRQIDDVDALFGLSESVMRLAPRLQRYLETIFVAGEWSAKPVFLRGIYFTSSMREGKALDEMASYITGVPVDQVQEIRSWDKNRAFFLRDLFNEKVFREFGLVTRATNTMQLLRRRKLMFFGMFAVVLVLTLVLAYFAFRSLKTSVMKEATYWQAGAGNWNQGIWSPPIVVPGENFHFSFGGSNLVTGVDNLSLLKFHENLGQIVKAPLEVSWIFQPMTWFNGGAVDDRAKAQRLLFEASVIKPLFLNARVKMIQDDPSVGGEASMIRHREALLALMNLEADALIGGQVSLDAQAVGKCIKTMTSYLVDADITPDPLLASVLLGTYSRSGIEKNGGVWPPNYLLGGGVLTNNLAINIGLDKFQKASLRAQTNIEQNLRPLDVFGDKLYAYHLKELAWLASTNEPCQQLTKSLLPAKADLDGSWTSLQKMPGSQIETLTNLANRYKTLASTASAASASTLKAPLSQILLRLPESKQKSSLFSQIRDKLNDLASQAADSVLQSYKNRREAVTLVDANCLVSSSTNSPSFAYQSRWQIYNDACAVASNPLKADETLIGDQWKRFGELEKLAGLYRRNLAAYQGPLVDSVTITCNRIVSDSEERLKGEFVDAYLKVVAAKVAELESPSHWTLPALINSREWVARIDWDLKAGAIIGAQKDKLLPVAESLNGLKKVALNGIAKELYSRIGFPVFLNQTNAMTQPDLQNLRELLGGLSRELSNAVWQNSPELADLDQRREAVNSLLNALMAPDGTFAEWELWFIPPAQESEADQTILKIFPFVQVTVGNKNAESDNLTRSAAPVLLVKSPANAGSQIAFQRFAGDASAEVLKGVQADWAVVRLIQEYGAERKANGSIWRFVVPVEDSKQKLNGNFTFEIRLADARQSLPKLAAWPKQ